LYGKPRSAHAVATWPRAGPAAQGDDPQHSDQGSQNSAAGVLRTLVWVGRPAGLRPGFAERGGLRSANAGLRAVTTVPGHVVTGAPVRYENPARNPAALVPGRVLTRFGPRSLREPHPEPRRRRSGWGSRAWAEPADPRLAAW